MFGLEGCGYALLMSGHWVHQEKKTFSEFDLKSRGHLKMKSLLLSICSDLLYLLDKKCFKTTPPKKHNCFEILNPLKEGSALWAAHLHRSMKREEWTEMWCEQRVVWHECRHTPSLAFCHTFSAIIGYNIKGVLLISMHLLELPLLVSCCQKPAET